MLPTHSENPSDTLEVFVARAHALHEKVSVVADTLLPLQDEEFVFVGARVSTERGDNFGWRLVPRSDSSTFVERVHEAKTFALIEALSYAIARERGERGAAAGERRPLITPSPVLPELPSDGPVVPCDECGKPLRAYPGGGMLLPVDRLAQHGVDRYGMTLCANCLITHNRERLAG